MWRHGIAFATRVILATEPVSATKLYRLGIAYVLNAHGAVLHDVRVFAEHPSQQPQATATEAKIFPRTLATRPPFSLG